MILIYGFSLTTVAMGGRPALQSLASVFSSQFNTQDYAMCGAIVIFFCMFYTYILDKWQLWFRTRALLPRLNRQDGKM
jgi:hypothetical protein